MVISQGYGYNVEFALLDITYVDIICVSKGSKC